MPIEPKDGAIHRPPMFSVVIPTYNRLDLLKQALASVWAQTFTDYEVIVVDDGSADGTREWLTRQTRRIRTVSQPNRGPGAARNAGVGEAAGKYVAFLDSDDVWLPWTLDVYMGAINAWSEPSFLAGKPTFFTDLQELEGVTAEERQAVAFPDYLASGDQWRWWGVSSFVVRRNTFVAANGFCERHVNGEDGDLALRLGSASGFVQILSPATFAYREQQDSLMKDFKLTLEGTRFMIEAEQRGNYPGGNERALERRQIVTRHTRPVVIDCLQRRLWRDAWDLYKSTFVWNASLGRLKFLCGFPFLAAVEALRGGRIAGRPDVSFY